MIIINKICILFDFDGIFAPLEALWEVLEQYSQKEQILLKEQQKKEIRQIVTTNQNKLNELLKKFQITKLDLINDIYLNIIKLNHGSHKLISLCHSKQIPYLFFSGASKKRIFETFQKYGIIIDQKIIYTANNKKKKDLKTMKSTITKLYPEITNIIYIDDFPPALKAGKENGMTTIYMKNNIFNISDKNYSKLKKFIDIQVSSLMEMKKLISIKYH